MSDSEDQVGHCDICESEYEIGDQSAVRVCMLCDRGVCMQCVGLCFTGSVDCECKICFAYKCAECGAALDQTAIYLDGFWCVGCSEG